jgi:phosphoribosyl 1,2-cyclic phosphodiesterase
MFFVRFWGVRGSIPCPGKDTIEFGGNTSCIELRAGNRIIIIDFGSGLKDLSARLLSEDSGGKAPDIDCFLSHTHLDHIFGLPMFAQVFNPETKLRIHGPLLPGGKKLKTVVENIITYEYWPIKLPGFSTNISFEQIGETTLDLGGGLCVRTKYLNHPVISLGYRFEYRGKSIVTAYDNESFWNLFASANKNNNFYNDDAALAGERAALEENKKLLDFYKNADILIYDSQYSESEYVSGKRNWGHSTYERAIDAARDAKVKKLLLFHHDPKRTDKALHKLENEYRQHALSAEKLEVIMAREGLVVKA